MASRQAMNSFRYRSTARLKLFLHARRSLSNSILSARANKCYCDITEIIKRSSYTFDIFISYFQKRSKDRAWRPWLKFLISFYCNLYFLRRLTQRSNYQAKPRRRRRIPKRQTDLRSEEVKTVSAGRLRMKNEKGWRTLRRAIKRGGGEGDRKGRRGGIVSAIIYGEF